MKIKGGSWPEDGAFAASPCSGSNRNLLEKLGLSLPPIQSFLWMMAKEALHRAGKGWKVPGACGGQGWRMGKDLGSRAAVKHLNSDLPVFAVGFPQWFELFPQWLLHTAGVRPDPNLPASQTQGWKQCSLQSHSSCFPEGLCSPSGDCSGEMSEQIGSKCKAAEIAVLFLVLSFSPSLGICRGDPWAALGAALTEGIRHHPSDNRFYSLLINSVQAPEIHL